MWLDADLAVKRIGTVGEGKDEAGMMTDFAEFMGKWRPHVVTWNGRGFDLPVLALRALRFGLDFRWYYRGEGYRYRFTEEGHLDLCDVISDHGAAKMTSLDGAARVIGLPGKDGVDGSQVEGLYNAGQLDALRRYCLADVTQTAFLFLRYRLVSARSIATATGAPPAAMLAALETDGRVRPVARRHRPARGCCSSDVSDVRRAGSAGARVLRAADDDRRRASCSGKLLVRSRARTAAAGRAHRRGRGVSGRARRGVARAPRAHAARGDHVRPARVPLRLPDLRHAPLHERRDRDRRRRGRRAHPRRGARSSGSTPAPAKGRRHR